MIPEEWVRLYPGERDAIVLNLLACEGYRYSYHDDHLWYSIRGSQERQCDDNKSSSSDLDYCARLEYEIKHRGFRDKYLRELCRMLIGFAPNTIQFEDLWPLITATPSERCLAAYNVLEDRQ